MKKYSARRVKTEGKSDTSSPPAHLPNCPECGSQRLWKDGLRHLTNGEHIQRFLCRACGFRFSESTANREVEVDVAGQVLEDSDSGKNLLQPDVFQGEFSLEPSAEKLTFEGGEDVGSHRSSEQTIVGKSLYAFPDYNRERRVCATVEGAKNLDATKKERGEVAGATTQKLQQSKDLIKNFPKPIRGKILEYAVRRLNQGYSEQGVKSYLFNLRTLKRHRADLNDPESVKEAVSRMKVGNRTKSLLVAVYDSFLKFLGGSWQKPNYAFSRKMPFIPLETEVDELIAACSPTVSAFLQVCKETGGRKREVAQIRWIDVDFERKIIAINYPEKGSNSRQIKVSNKCTRMVDGRPRKNERVFSINSVDRQFYGQRKRIAARLDNPRLLSISFHTLRHFKGTMEYHKTKDILRVKYILGHKNIRNTLIYINLENTLFQGTGDDAFHVRVAKTVDEACKLLEVGFEYVCDMDDVKLFRKRK